MLGSFVLHPKFLAHYYRFSLVMMKFEFLLCTEYNGCNGWHGRHAEGSKVAQCPYQKQVSHTFLCHVTSHGWIKPNDAGI